MPLDETVSLGTLVTVCVCVAAAAAGPSALAWALWKRSEWLALQLQHRTQRLLEMKRENALTRVWRPDERPDFGG